MMPTVCVIIPCRNEGDRLERCVRAALAFDVPKDVRVEVYIFDGMSTDHTADVAKKLALEDPRVHYRWNSRISQGCAVNTAVRESGADFYLWLGVHCEFPKDYLLVCLETMLRTKADVVGGICETRPGGPGYGAALVQALTTHRFGVGGGEFRVGGPEHAVDTVPYALFHERVFRKIGLLDERLIRAQDYEFNRRVALAGGVVWQNPAIRVGYYNQPSLQRFLTKQLTLEAPYNAYLWYLAPYAFTPRHAITAAFASFLILNLLLATIFVFPAVVLAATLTTYSIAALASAAQQSRRYGRASFLVALPPSFFVFHFVHGMGVLTGLAKLLAGRAPVQREAEPWAGAGCARISRMELAKRLVNE